MARTRAEEARDLSRKLFAVGRRMKADFDAVAEARGLTPLQARTLLGLEEPVPMRSLAQDMACDASNVTGLADRLERLGLVERAADPVDRRVKRLGLTAEGARLRTELAKAVADESAAMARLTIAERRELERLLDTLLEGHGDTDEACAGH